MQKLVNYRYLCEVVELYVKIQNYIDPNPKENNEF